MPKPRSAQVSLEATPYYHCTSRCVRRAFLCGFNVDTNKDYEYRRQWLEDKLLDTADIFAIDICAYAIMSNHYHAVLHINKAQAEAWSFDEVIH
ncbi:Mobile element protein, partial [hydrothermal vent metagenome]